MNMNRAQRRHLESLSKKKGDLMKPGQSMKVPMNVPLVGQGTPAAKEQELMKRIHMLQKANASLQKEKIELVTELRSMSRISRALYESYQELMDTHGIALSKEELADAFLKHVEKITAAIMPKPGDEVEDEHLQSVAERSGEDRDQDSKEAAREEVTDGAE